MLSKYFQEHEFMCRCGCGRSNISQTLVAKLDQLRALVGFPLVVSSGCRCKTYNKRVGGREESAHLSEGEQCEAVDLFVANGKDRFTIIRYAYTVGFTRIGIGDSFIHLDVDTQKPQFTIWTYGKEVIR